MLYINILQNHENQDFIFLWATDNRKKASLPELTKLYLKAFPDLYIASLMAFALKSSCWYALLIARSASTFANWACFAKRLVFDLGITVKTLSGSDQRKSQGRVSFEREEDFLGINYLYNYLSQDEAKWCLSE